MAATARIHDGSVKWMSGIVFYHRGKTKRKVLYAMENLPNARPEINFYKWDEQILDLATSKHDILKILVSGKENGNTVGIKSRLLGDGFYITAVEEIILEEGSTTFLFMPFDITGFILPTRRLKLADIDAACPLISEFQNPILRNFEKDKTWFF
jgi:hypothetical protein